MPFVAKSFVASLLRRFWRARSGNVALLAGLLIFPLLAMIGLAVDYGMAGLMRARLDKAAQASALSGANQARNYLQGFRLTNSTQDSDAINSGQNASYNTFIGQMDSIKKWTLTQLNVKVTRVGNTLSSETTYGGTYDTAFGKLFGVNQIKITGQGTIIIGMVDNPPNTRVLEEIWSDTALTDGKPVSLTQETYRDWFISAPEFEGTRAGGRTDFGTLLPTGDARAGNTAIRIGRGYNDVLSKKVFLPAGAYELRYWYKSAVEYPQYKPAYICHIMRESLDWASDGRWRNWGSSTLTLNEPFTVRMGTYLDPISGDPRLATIPPSKLVPYAANGAAANNRIDDCVYAHNWIQRTIKLTITDTGYFWLSFATEFPAGPGTKNGAYIGKVTLCIVACSDPVVDNMPWYALKGKGVHSLMTDGFETPVLTGDTKSAVSDWIPWSQQPDPAVLTSGTYSSTYEPNSALQMWHPKRWNSSPGTFSYMNSRFPADNGTASAGYQHGSLTGYGAVNTLWRRVLLTPGLYLYNVSMRVTGNAMGCITVGTSYDSRDIYADTSAAGWSTLDYRQVYDSASWCDFVGSSWGRESHCVAVTATRFYDFGVFIPNIMSANSSLRLDDVQVQASKGPTEMPYTNSFMYAFNNCRYSNIMSAAGLDWGPPVREFYKNRVIVYYNPMQ